MIWITLVWSQATAAEPSVYRAGLADASGWEMVGTKEIEGLGQVTIRNKQVANQECLEGVTHTTAKPDVMLAVAADIPSATQWSSWDLPESVVITKTPFHYFQVLDNPWPVNDRGWFLTATTSVSGNVSRLDWHHIDAHALYPDKMAQLKGRHDGIVFTGVNVGAWVFTQQSDGKTEVRYQICSDPGGTLPSSAAEFAARTTLPVTVGDLIREAMKR